MRDNGGDDQQDLEPEKKDPTNFWNEDVVLPTDVKNQHYVPQMFLRGFAGSDGLVHRLDLHTGQTLRTSTRNIGSENWFNNFEIEGVEVSTEGWLAELENAAGPLLHRLIEDPAELLAFTVDEQMHFARFLGAFRVPAFRAQMGALRQQMVGFAKKIAQSRLENDLKDDPSARKLIWDEWQQQPDDWWLGQDRPFDAAELTAAMLKEIQGYANMLWSMPWRIGRVPDHLRLYTSDNPLGNYLQPIRPWWETGGFASMFYYVPLSPSVLLRIAPFSDHAQIGEPGRPVVCPASGWDAAMATHVQSAGATRYLFGDGPFLGKEDAMREIVEYEVAAITACKVWLNWSGDEPRTIDLPGGRKGTPARMTPVQQKMAEMRKRIHERKREPSPIAAPLRSCPQHPL